MKLEQLLEQFGNVIDSPDAISRLRTFILDMAVRGRLVEQDSNDESVTELLKRMDQEKQKDANTLGTKNIDKIFECEPSYIPFGIPTEWTWTVLQRLARVEMGQSPQSQHYNQIGNGLPFYQGKTDFGIRYPSPRYWCTHPKKIALPWDILISIRAPVGPINIANEKCCIGRGLAALRPYSDMCTDFVVVLLKSFELNVAAMGFGSTFMAINKKQLTRFLLPLPPLPEQHRIVAKVNELMAHCDQLEEKFNERESSRQKFLEAVLHELLTNTWTK